MNWQRQGWGTERKGKTEGRGSGLQAESIVGKWVLLDRREHLGESLLVGTWGMCFGERETGASFHSWDGAASCIFF